MLPHVVCLNVDFELVALLERDAELQCIDGVQAQPVSEQRSGSVDVSWSDVLEIEHIDDQDFDDVDRSEEHTSELQSLMRISYAVFCLKKKNSKHTSTPIEQNTNTYI